jgi:hypothetical protein
MTRHASFILIDSARKWYAKIDFPALGGPYTMVTVLSGIPPDVTASRLSIPELILLNAEEDVSVDQRCYEKLWSNAIMTF